MMISEIKHIYLYTKNYILFPSESYYIPTRWILMGIALLYFDKQLIKLFLLVCILERNDFSLSCFSFI